MPLAPERWKEVQRLFHEAAELSPDERQGFLAGACADQDLCREVEALLGWQAKSGSFIEAPAIEVAAMTLAASYAEPVPGQMLGRFRVDSRLGSGGMAVVYKAEDTRLGRIVALKFLLEGSTADPDALERFRIEARALSALNHPNICAIYDICEEGGRSFIAMEHVAGQRLDHLIARSAIRPHETLRYAVQIAAGLASAHAAGIIHRDLKPGNIMITDDAQVKLLDFGVAKLVRGAAANSPTAETATLTQVGAIVGTAAYMSPEQAEAKDIDARSDVFAFGTVLYEMITGRRAFAGSSPIATLAAVLRTDPEPIGRVSSAVPGELERIVSRCLRKDPNRRFQTAADLKVALEEIRDETEAGKLKAVHFLPGPATIKRSHAAIAALVALLIIASVTWFWLRARSLSPIPADKRIAVLLFKNVGGDPANQAFCDGLMEEVSNSLTRLEQFHGALIVVPASDVLKEGITSARDAGKSLGANLAITGSVERVPNGAVHVLINLVDTRSVAQLRTESIDTKDPDLPNLQDSVMRKVTGMLELVLKPDAARAVKGGTTSSAAAYAAYVKGLGYLRRYDRIENVDSAIASFKRAVDIDSQYVLPFAGIAEAYWRRYEALKDSNSMDSALEYSSRALALNDGLAPAHITMGIIRAGKGQYEMAEGEFKTALKLDPLNAHGWLELANVYDASGKRDLAQDSYRRAIELRNDDWAALNKLGVSYVRKAQYQEAEPYFLQVVQLTPDSAKAYSNLGGLYLKMDRFVEAANQLRKSIRIEPTAAGWSNLGSAYYFAGRYSDAIVPFEKATALTPANSTLWGNLADAYRWTPSQSAKAPATYKRALALIEKEIAVNPREAELHAQAATYYVALGDRERADLELEAAMSQAPNDANVQFCAALVYEQEGRRERALLAVRAARDVGYDRAEIDNAPPLKGLREDSRYRASTGTNSQ